MRRKKRKALWQAEERRRAGGQRRTGTDSTVSFVSKTCFARGCRLHVAQYVISLLRTEMHVFGMIEKDHRVGGRELPVGCGRTLVS